MTELLARTADRLYWGARYLERVEDTARVVRAYNDLVVDYDSPEMLSWEPLAALAGSDKRVDIADGSTGEREVLAFMICDRSNPSSILSAVTAARSNLRTTREVLPREAWQTMNQLSQYVAATCTGAVERQLRDRFLQRVVEFSRRLDGITESTMTRSQAYHVMRLGRLIERADMTTRVLGVAAASILATEAAQRMAGEREHLVIDEVRWMSILRSISALQMYQQAVRGPIDGLTVVQFLLSYSAFPRSVQGCFDEIRGLVYLLPNAERIEPSLDAADRMLAASDPDVTAGAGLDQSMEQLQAAIAELAGAIHDTYVGSVI